MSSKGRVSKPSKTFTAEQAKDIIMNDKGKGRSTKTFYSSVKSGESTTGETSSTKKSTTGKSKSKPPPKPKGKKKDAEIEKEKAVKTKQSKKKEIEKKKSSHFKEKKGS